MYNTLLLLLTATFAIPSLRVDFVTAAKKHNIEPRLLEAICRFESGHGRFKYHKNRNGSWDVGLCQNHRGVSENRPAIPANHISVKEAAKELAYWKREHNKYCVALYSASGACGKTINGKWRGVKNCHRPHPYWSHYNHGYRVLRNGYAKRVACFMLSGLRKCSKQEWKKINFETSPHPRRYQW
jgi:hypothetical protein